MSQAPFSPFQPQPARLPYPPTPPLASFQTAGNPDPATVSAQAQEPVRRRTVPLAPFVAVLVLTAVLASALAGLGARSALAGRGASSSEPAGAIAAVPPPRAAAPVSTRLAVTAPRRVLDTPTAPGTERLLPLPSLPPATSAVLLQVSVIAAEQPGLVTVRSSVEEVPGPRAGAAGGQSTATVVALLGADRRLRVRNEAGGRLVVTLVGTFEPAGRSSWGRIVVTPARSVVRLRPVVDGHDAELDLRGVRALPGGGQISAVLLRFAGEVGSHGGYVAVGRSPHHLDQRVLWSATSGSDLIRNGLIVVPVAADHPDRLYLHYKAGTELRAEVVGYVTGPRALASASGLSVPVPARQAPAVRVAARGRRSVQLVPDQGVAGVLPARVGAVLTYLSAVGETPGPVSVLAPGGRPTSVPDLSAATKARSALALTRVDRGRVTLASGSDAAVILTPRLLILR